MFDEKDQVVTPEQQDAALAQMMGIVEQPTADNQSTVQTQPVVDNLETTAKPKPKPAESFNQLKKKALELEREAERNARERDEAVRYARELQARYQQPLVQQTQVEEEDIAINPDAYAEGKQLQKVIKRYDQKLKNLEEKLTQSEQKSVNMAVEARLKATYQDFDQVVNQNTLHLLSKEHPDLAQTINSSSDLYSKAATAYKIIKKFGIGQDIEPEYNYEQEKEEIKQNLAKPKASNIVSPQNAVKQQMGSSGNFESQAQKQARREQQWRDMQAAMSNKSS